MVLEFTISPAFTLGHKFGNFSSLFSFYLIRREFHHAIQHCNFHPKMFPSCASVHWFSFCFQTDTCLYPGGGISTCSPIQSESTFFCNSHKFPFVAISSWQIWLLNWKKLGPSTRICIILFLQLHLADDKYSNLCTCNSKLFSHNSDGIAIATFLWIIFLVAKKLLYGFTSTALGKIGSYS